MDGVHDARIGPASVQRTAISAMRELALGISRHGMADHVQVSKTISICTLSYADGQTSFMIPNAKQSP